LGSVAVGIPNRLADGVRPMPSPQRERQRKCEKMKKELGKNSSSHNAPLHGGITRRITVSMFFMPRTVAPYYCRPMPATPLESIVNFIFRKVRGSVQMFVGKRRARIF